MAGGKVVWTLRALIILLPKTDRWVQGPSHIWNKFQKRASGRSKMQYESMSHADHFAIEPKEKRRWHAPTQASGEASWLKTYELAPLIMACQHQNWRMSVIGVL